MSARFLSVLMATSLAMTSVRAVEAQTDVTLELGASQVGPPVGVDARSARFGVAGIRASHYRLSGSGASASLLAGRTVGDPNGGDFLSAALGGSLVESLGARMTASWDLRLLGFAVRAPFPYRAVAAEGGPTLRLRTSAVTMSASLLAGLGQSRVELWRVADGPTRVFEDELWRVGGTTDVLVGSGPIRFGVTAGAHDTPGGTYTAAGGRVVVSGGWGAAEVRADVWDTPLGTQTTGGLVFVIPVAGWSLRGFLGRSEPDPLTLAEPGSGSGALLVGRSLFTRDPGSGTRGAPYEILDQSPHGAWVRMTLELTGNVTTVELLGDFTLWDTVLMHRDGDRWSVELEVGNGTHHFGFLVDGDWYVPEETRDVVPDEWGRQSAILVIEGEG